MISIHSLGLAALLPVIGIAACHIGGDAMNMPPPASTPTQTSGAPASEVDPNLHVTLPPGAGASTGVKGMPGMGASDAGMAPMGTGGMSMDAGKPTPNTGKKMAPMDASAPMAPMADAGMKPGCCGGPMPMPMPMPPMTPPAHPMPMSPEHGGGHM